MAQVSSSETITEQLRRALEREEWSRVVDLAKDPVSASVVINAKVGWGGGTALHMASYCHKLDVSVVLLAAGAQLASQDKEGYTPLHIASLSGSQIVARLLLDKGADVSAVNAYGWTPLHAAAVNGHVGVALLLLERGAQAHAKANDGRTPVEIAEASGRMQIIEVLRGAPNGTERREKPRRRIITEDDDDDEDDEDDVDDIPTAKNADNMVNKPPKKQELNGPANAPQEQQVADETRKDDKNDIVVCSLHAKRTRIENGEEARPSAGINEQPNREESQNSATKKPRTSCQQGEKQPLAAPAQQTAGNIVQNTSFGAGDQTTTEANGKLNQIPLSPCLPIFPPPPAQPRNLPTRRKDPRVHESDNALRNQMQMQTHMQIQGQTQVQAQTQSQAKTNAAKQSIPPTQALAQAQAQAQAQALSLSQPMSQVQTHTQSQQQPQGVMQSQVPLQLRGPAQSQGEVLPQAIVQSQGPIQSRGQTQPLARYASGAADIGRLNVAEVAKLMIRYVCEGHDNETKERFSRIIMRGVLMYRLTGRALLAPDPSPSDLARALILGQRSVGFDYKAPCVERDVLYFGVMDFIRTARARHSSSSVFH